MSTTLIECVPNFSEGRDGAVIGAIESAIASAAGTRMLDRTADPDHNRCVITFAAPIDSAVEAAFRGVREAVERIDLTKHAGVHPRIGAADVVPFVPLGRATLADCEALATELAARVWRELGVPVYLYEAAARRSDRVNLEVVRRGGFENLRNEVRTNPQRLPDFGGAELHPTAGAVAIGARKLLVALNVHLETGDVETAKRIAKKIRASSGGFPCVKALGLDLPTRGHAQVSMNFTDFECTPIHVVFDAIRAEAAIGGSELIGLIPQEALEDSESWLGTVENWSEDRILENRLEATG